jgi:hypothetical protein
MTPEQLAEKRKHDAAYYRSLDSYEKADRLEKSKQWHLAHPYEAAAYCRKWLNNSYHTDQIFRAAHLIRTRLAAAYRKYLKTGEYIQARDGADFEAIFRSLGDPPSKWGKGLGMYTFQHIIPLRQLDLINDPVDLAIAWDAENICWMLWETNRKISNEWTPEVEELYQRLRTKHTPREGEG